MIVILKPLDGQGYPGYGIATDGSVWSRWNTHAQITNVWSQRETFFKHGARYVKLQVQGYTREVRVAKLLLEAAFRELPDFLAGSKIRYLDGDRSNCSLTNVRYGSRKSTYFDGAMYATGAPPGFSKVKV